MERRLKTAPQGRQPHSALPGHRERCDLASRRRHNTELESLPSQSPSRFSRFPEFAGYFEPNESINDIEMSWRRIFRKMKGITKENLRIKMKQGVGGGHYLPRTLKIGFTRPDEGFCPCHPKYHGKLSAAPFGVPNSPASFQNIFNPSYLWRNI